MRTYTTHADRIAIHSARLGYQTIGYMTADLRPEHIAIDARADAVGRETATSSQGGSATKGGPK